MTNNSASQTIDLRFAVVTEEKPAAGWTATVSLADNTLLTTKAVDSEEEARKLAEQELAGLVTAALLSTTVMAS
jgi:hypothetical protein